MELIIIAIKVVAIIMEIKDQIIMNRHNMLFKN